MNVVRVFEWILRIFIKLFIITSVLTIINSVQDITCTDNLTVTEPAVQNLFMIVQKDLEYDDANYDPSHGGIYGECEKLGFVEMDDNGNCESPHFQKVEGKLCCLQCQQFCGQGQEKRNGCICILCRSHHFSLANEIKCQPCLVCSSIGRIETETCTSTQDASCGGCLPGYANKTSAGSRECQKIEHDQQINKSTNSMNNTTALSTTGSDSPVQVISTTFIVIIACVIGVLLIIIGTITIAYFARKKMKQKKNEGIEISNNSIGNLPTNGQIPGRGDNVTDPFLPLSGIEDSGSNTVPSLSLTELSSIVTCNGEVETQAQVDIHRERSIMNSNVFPPTIIEVTDVERNSVGENSGYRSVHTGSGVNGPRYHLTHPEVDELPAQVHVQ